MTALVGSERIGWNCDWRCDKWGEDAVEWAQRRLVRNGVDVLPTVNELVPDPRLRVRLGARLGGLEVPRIKVRRFMPVTLGVTSEALRRLIGDPDIVDEVHGNLLLNTGITEMLNCIANENSPITWQNSTAQIGVGSDATAANASQTDLLDASDTWKGMNGVYPTVTAQSCDWQADFTSGEANEAWEEWGIRNDSTDQILMNRKAESLGTKSGGTWTLTATISLS